MDLIILSPPLSHFIPLKVHIHNINSVGKEVKEYVSCGQNNWLTQFFFRSIALLSDIAPVQSCSNGERLQLTKIIHASVIFSSSN